MPILSRSRYKTWEIRSPRPDTYQMLKPIIFSNVIETTLSKFCITYLPDEKSHCFPWVWMSWSSTRFVPVPGLSLRAIPQPLNMIPGYFHGKKRRQRKPCLFLYLLVVGTPCNNLTVLLILTVKKLINSYITKPQICMPWSWVIMSTSRIILQCHLYCFCCN